MNHSGFSRMWLLILVLILIVAAGWWLLWGGSRVQRSGDFTIQEGASARIVWQALADEGFSRRTLPWRYYAWRTNAADKLQAGTYRLERGELISQVIQRFREGDAIPDEFTITYPEGFTLDQMATRTAARNIGTKEEFMAAARPQAFVERYPYLKAIPANRTLEGYLFPDTYRVAADETPGDLIQRMVGTFNARLTPELQAEILETNRTIDEIVIMASIIEREVISDKDMAMVSGVLWKRVDEGIGLAADASIRYALNKWDGALTVDDLRIDSPYNTRRYRGLPPGPISNPGLRALLAAIRPEASEYYYYLSTPEGETIFAKTNDEHNQNKAKYLQ
jgi:UPF0755 protein